MYYGFDMGGTKIELAVFDEEMNQVWIKRHPTPKNNYDDLLCVFVELVKEADERFNTQGSIGIGIPGIPNVSNGTVFTTNVPSAKGKPLAADLTKMLNRPVKISNDANCFALSEAYAPVFKKYRSVLGLILGTGVGGGLIIDGKPVTGHNGITAEIGHLRITLDMLTILGMDIPKRQCGCGHIGCAETYLSGEGFEWLFNHFYHLSLSAQAIVALYRQGDAHATEHVERYTSLLASYLGNILTLFDTELVVIGGGLSNFDELYTLLPQKLPLYIYSIATLPQIEKARYGDSGGVRGAAFLHLGSPA